MGPDIHEDINFENFEQASSMANGEYYSGASPVIPWQNIGLSIISRMEIMDKKIDNMIKTLDSVVKNTNEEFKTINNDIAVLKTIVKGILWSLGIAVSLVVGYVGFTWQQDYSEKSDKASKYEKMIRDRYKNKPSEMPKKPKGDTSVSIFYRFDNREKNINFNNKEFT